MKPSPEQKVIISSILDGKNVIVDAVAGSGKTTTILFTAKKCKKQIVMITYNRSIANEVIKKSKSIENLKIYTYHSLYYHYYDKCINDKDLLMLVCENITINIEETPDILIIDESQDMTEEYYDAIVKFIKDIGTVKQLILFGDKRQCIYQYKGADPKFFNEEFWPDRDFIRHQLNTSYRLTKSTADFVNNCMIGENLIIPGNLSENFPVEYIAGEKWYEIGKTVFNQVTRMLENGEYKPEDIFILMASTKNTGRTIHKIVNELSAKKIPIYKREDFNERPNPKVTKGKIILSTFHGCKGMERKVVIIVGFDMAYFTYYAREMDPFICPNTLYVAVTRAISRCILIQSTEKLCFLTDIENYCNIYGSLECNNVPSRDQNFTSVTKLIEYLPARIEAYYEKHILSKIFITRQKPHDIIKIPLTVKCGDTREEVSAITGIAITEMFRYIITEKCWLDDIKGFTVVDELWKIFCHLKQTEKRDISFFLKVANLQLAYSDKMIYHLRQIKYYNWIDDDRASELIENFPDIGDDPKFEEDIEYGGIKGRMDLVDDHKVFEFKCVETLTFSHKLQLCYYAWMWNKKYPDENKRFYLVNLRTCERLQLRDINEIDEMCDTIWKYKTGLMNLDDFRKSHKI